jgi:hypothetical protein
LNQQQPQQNDQQLQQLHEPNQHQQQQHPQNQQRRQEPHQSHQEQQQQFHRHQQLVELQPQQFDPRTNRQTQQFTLNNPRLVGREVDSHNQFQPAAHSTPGNDIQRLNEDIRALRQELLRLRNENEQLYAQTTMRRILANETSRQEATELSAARRLLKIFNGNPDENFADWLFNLERYFIRAKISNDEKANFSLDYLEGNARKIFLSVSNCLNFP